MVSLHDKVMSHSISDTGFTYIFSPRLALKLMTNTVDISRRGICLKGNNKSYFHID